MKIISNILFVYLIVLVLMFSFQRDFIYFPQPEIESPEFYGLNNFEETRLPNNEGVEGKAWHNDFKERETTILYFHGNAETLSNNVDLYKKLDAAGLGVFAVTYRGYGGSEGKPSETGNYIDAEAAIKTISRDIDPSKLVVVGRSLGTGIAVDLAAKHDLGGVVLISPFTSLADIGAKQFPFIPARYLLLDRYDSLQKIAKVDEKLRIVHGSKDNLVPIALGKELYNAANEPKEFITLEGVGHNDVSLDAIADNIIGFTNAR